MEFTSHSGPASQCAWSGQGRGSVTTEPFADGVKFHERGHFRPSGSKREIAFTNTYRWEFVSGGLRLFHERRGAEHAVWLFDLEETPGGDWLARHAHQCGEDRYTARLTPSATGFELRWRIDGPRKDEHLHYRYAQQ
ncbi:hypothetical protein HIO72_08510 [Halomonas sp. PA5]|uniref:DUF6314 family protein n=1 Tax=Halomonas sp. PA5 TaxID=2730357 RepID=UPI001597D083|nr:DUF6314 family protein [Halomonas sp. PA5]QJQ95310.1 hypothetical protein HIO72_08510 [Halomonas sp. PA5]